MQYYIACISYEGMRIIVQVTCYSADLQLAIMGIGNVHKSFCGACMTSLQMAVKHIVEHTSCRWQSCFRKRMYTAKELILIFCTSTVCGRRRLPLERFHWLWMPGDHSAGCAEKQATCCSATPCFPMWQAY